MQIDKLDLLKTQLGQIEHLLLPENLQTAGDLVRLLNQFEHVGSPRAYLLGVDLSSDLEDDRLEV